MKKFLKKIFQKPSSETKTFDSTQEQVYLAGLELMKTIDGEYREHVRMCKKKLSDKGLYSARVFSILFPISAMTLALGKEKHQLSESVYRELIFECGQNLKLSKPEQIKISKTILREGSLALIAEKNNVGSGQYALAALYEGALNLSVGSVEGLAERLEPPLSSLMGRMVGEKLAAWA